MILTRRAALASGGAVFGTIAAPGWALTVKTSPPELVAGRLIQGGWARGNVLAGLARPAHISFDGQRVPVDEVGNFFVGFDRDCGSVATLSIPHGNTEHLVELEIAPGNWQIEQIDAPFHPPAMPDETFAALRKDELARIDAARSHDTGAAGWRQQFTWPVKGRISGKFGAQRVYRGPSGQPQPGSYHSGLDIATGTSGTPYAAPADGVVVLAAASPFTLEGNLLMIDHGMGLSSAFLHSEKLLVREGDKVAQGQPIGQIGMSGRATGPHLHWSLRWHEARLDPALMVGA